MSRPVHRSTDTRSVHSQREHVGIVILADTAGDGRVGPLMGVMDMSVALGATLSRVCEGFLYHRFEYPAVFMSTYILIALNFALRLLMPERQGKALGRRKDGKQGPKPDCADR